MSYGPARGPSPPQQVVRGIVVGGPGFQGSWAPVRLFAVGVAWGAPFLLLSFISLDTSSSATPQPAALLDALSWPLVAIACLAAVAGVGTVLRLSGGPSPGMRWSRLAWPLALLVFVTLAASFPSSLLAVLIMMVLVFALLLLVGGGVITSLAALWQHRHWWALLWAGVWTALIVLLIVAGLQTGQTPASPRTPLLATDALLLASALAALLLPRLVHRRWERREHADSGTELELQSQIKDQLKAQTKQRT